MQATAYFDLRNMTNTMTNTTAMESTIPLPAQGIPSDHLEMQLFIDHSQLEFYALGGLAVGTIKVYPNNMSEGNWTLSLVSLADEAEVSAKVKLEHLHSCWTVNATADLVPDSHIEGHTALDDEDLYLLPW